MLLQRFVDWLYRNFGAARPANTISGAENQPQSTPGDGNVPISRQNLSESADNYDARQLQLANELYDAFVATEYKRLLAWIEHLLKEDADYGGRHLSLTFDHSPSRIKALGSGLIQSYVFKGGNPQFELPFSNCLASPTVVVERLAMSIADHFRALMFNVDVQRHERTFSLRYGSSPESTEVTIGWGATKTVPVVCDDRESIDTEASLGGIDRFEPFSITHRDPSYQTAPLVDYDPILQEQALALFQCVEERLGRTKAKAYKGSYSMLSSGGSQTAAKIIIYANGLGRMNGDWPSLPDGVYVLIRADGLLGDRIWSDVPHISDVLDRTCTIGIAPNHSERFAYFMVSEQDDKEQIAELILRCATISA